MIPIQDFQVAPSADQRSFAVRRVRDVLPESVLDLRIPLANRLMVSRFRWCWHRRRPLFRVAIESIEIDGTYKAMQAAG